MEATISKFCSLTDRNFLKSGVFRRYHVWNSPTNFVDPFGLFSFTIGFQGSGALFGFGTTGGIYANFAHDPSKPWYSGWSSSVTEVLGAGGAGSVYGLSGGVHLSVSNACNVKQLEKGFSNLARLGLGTFSIEGYRSLDGSVTGGGVTLGPSLGYIGTFGGGSYTWTITGGSWEGFYAR